MIKGMLTKVETMVVERLHWKVDVPYYVFEHLNVLLCTGIMTQYLDSRSMISLFELQNILC